MPNYVFLNIIRKLCCISILTVAIKSIYSCSLYHNSLYVAIVRCESLTGPSNGEVIISIGTNGVERGVGAIATYSCNSEYRLVGVVTRTCGSTGLWTGLPPTCQGTYCYNNTLQHSNMTIIATTHIWRKCNKS